MKKIVVILAAAAVAASAFAVDFSAGMQLKGKLFNYDGASKKVDAMQLWNENGKDDKPFIFSLSSDRVGATLKLWDEEFWELPVGPNSWDDTFPAQAAGAWNIWFKPFDNVKVELGALDTKLNCEQITWWKGKVLGGANWGYKAYYEADGLTIAAALGNIPHYWWEFAIYNQQTPSNHLDIPGSSDDATGKQWVAGLEDIKDLYEKGFFPDNTLSATDDETFAMFTDGKAAFLLDGSWKVGGIVGSCQSDPEDPSTLDEEKLSHFDVTYFPSKGNRKTTDLVGGLSMGYYITTKAWEDPAKRDAAVSFVSHMTSDEVVPVFAQHTASALKNAPAVDESQFNPLQIKAMDMMSGVTSLTGAVQDLFNGDCRVSTFDGMPDIVVGNVSAADAVQEGIDVYKDSLE